VPICPHTDGLGLCEMAQHLQMWDFVCLSQTTENRVIEFIDCKHGYFVNPVYIVNGNYMPPTLPGYSTTFKKKAIQRWLYPSGSRWVYLFKLGSSEHSLRRKQQKALNRERRNHRDSFEEENAEEQMEIDETRNKQML
jgi:L-fuconate dehydratase